jgi:hypothetical protein
LRQTVSKKPDVVNQELLARVNIPSQGIEAIDIEDCTNLARSHPRDALSHEHLHDFIANLHLLLLILLA